MLSKMQIAGALIQRQARTGKSQNEKKQKSGKEVKSGRQTVVKSSSPTEKQKQTKTEEELKNHCLTTENTQDRIALRSVLVYPHSPPPVKLAHLLYFPGHTVIIGSNS